MNVIYTTNTHSIHMSTKYSNQEKVKPHGSNNDILSTMDGKRKINTKKFFTLLRYANI